MLMRLNKSVATINDVLKILDITNLRYYIHTHFNKFRFRIGALNQNFFFFFFFSITFNIFQRQTESNKA